LSRLATLGECGIVGGEVLKVVGSLTGGAKRLSLKDSRSLKMCVLKSNLTDSIRALEASKIASHSKTPLGEALAEVLRETNSMTQKTSAGQPCFEQHLSRVSIDCLVAALSKAGTHNGEERYSIISKQLLTPAAQTLRETKDVIETHLAAFSNSVE
jgi:hypothetical protein